jgi:hypothetical protein
VHEITASWSCALSCASSACDRPMLDWGCGGVHVSGCLWHQHQHGGVDAGAVGGGRRAPTRLLTLGFLNAQVGQAAQTIQSRPIVTPTPRKLICFTAIDLPLAPDPELKFNCLSNIKAYRHQQPPSCPPPSRNSRASGHALSPTSRTTANSTSCPSSPLIGSQRYCRIPC